LKKHKHVFLINLFIFQFLIQFSSNFKFLNFKFQQNEFNKFHHWHSNINEWLIDIFWHKILKNFIFSFEFNRKTSLHCFRKKWKNLFIFFGILLNRQWPIIIKLCKNVSEWICNHIICNWKLSQINDIGQWNSVKILKWILFDELFNELFILIYVPNVMIIVENVTIFFWWFKYW